MLFREGIRGLLEKEQDMEVIGEASNGSEAVELVNNLHPDVALMDIVMPVVNGLEATRQIKVVYPATAILILTAYDSDQNILYLLEAGVAGILLKNVSGNELANTIRAVHAGESVLHSVVAQKVFSRFARQELDLKNLGPPQELSEREIEILRLAAKGMSNQGIASKLFLSRRTVQAHLNNIFRKMGVGSRTEAILQALKKGWLFLDDIT